MIAIAESEFLIGFIGESKMAAFDLADKKGVGFYSVEDGEGEFLNFWGVIGGEQAEEQGVSVCVIFEYDSAEFFLP